MRYSDYQQRQLDIESGAALDRQAARWAKANPGKCTSCRGQGGWWSGYAGSSKLYWQRCGCTLEAKQAEPT